MSFGSGFGVLLAMALAGQPASPPLPPRHNPKIVTVAGSGSAGFSGDRRKGTEAELNNPYGLTVGPDGALYICEVDNNVIRRLDLQKGTIATVVGNVRRGYSGDGGPAIQASVNEPYELRFDLAGNMFFVERMNHIVRRVDHGTGIITTVAGTGKPGFGGDGGPAIHALLKEPHSLAFDKDGTLLVCDIGNHRLRRINLRTGIIDTAAGTGEPRDPAEGALYHGAPLNGPRTLDVDPNGRIYLAVREGNAVWRLDPDGTIHRVAGTGTKGYDGDGGAALKSRLSGPKGISWSPEPALYVADTENHVVRRIDLTTGIITTAAGTGSVGDGPDGDPLHCQLARPHGVYASGKGEVFIGDSENHRVRMVSASRRRKE